MNPLFKKHFCLSIGPQRCGTGWLERYFRARGDICLPEGVKEIFFFDRHYSRGPEFYQSHFHPLEEHIAVMELTTTAFDVPDAPRNVYNLLGGDIGLLCPLRDPVRRALNVYHDYLHYGIVSGSIAEAVEQAPQILFASRYGDHLGRWIDRFGKKKINAVFYETLEQDPKAYAKEVCEALSIPYVEPSADIPLTPMHAPTRLGFGNFVGQFLGSRKKIAEPVISGRSLEMEWLRERLRPEQERVEKLLGRVIPHWE